MEIAELNLIGDFEAGIKCLQNPSLLSQLSLTNKLYSFWTFGALIIAVFATFTSVFNRIHLFIHHIRFKLLSSCQNSSTQQILYDDDDFDFDFSDDDDGEDDTPSSLAESDDEEYDYDSSEDYKRVNDVFRAEGSSCYYENDEGQDGNFTRRTRFSWSDFSAGKSVVQLWDSFGLGLNFEEEDDDESGISIWDLDRGRVTADSGSEKVVVTADMDGDHSGVGFGTYDCKVGVRCPPICATWQPRQMKEE